MDAPYAILKRSSPGSPGCWRTIRRRSPSPARRPISSGEDEVVVDRSRARLARACRGDRRGDRRAAAGGDRLHPHPPRPQPGEPRAGRRDRARRSSAARRWRSTASGRAPMPASTSTMRPTACSAMARRSRSTASASSRSRRRGTRRTICASPIAARLFTGDHVMGWSTTRRGAARRRHGRLYGEPRQVARSATTASIIRRTGRR